MGLLDRARRAEAGDQRSPDHFGALTGLARSLEAQGRETEAAEMRERLSEAWREADVELPDWAIDDLRAMYGHYQERGAAAEAWQ